MNADESSYFRINNKGCALHSPCCLQELLSTALPPTQGVTSATCHTAHTRGASPSRASH